jgi:hypothetical protein
MISGKNLTIPELFLTPRTWVDSEKSVDGQKIF